MIKKWLKEYIEINKKDITFVVSFLILGIITGICIYIFLSNDVKELAVNSVKEVFDLSKSDGYVKTNIILNGIKGNIVLIIALSILSVTLFGKWVMYGIITLKGISLSLYTIFLFKIFGPLWGILVSFLLVILVNIIYIPALIYVVVTFLDINFNIFKVKVSNNNFSVFYKTAFNAFIAFLLMFSSTAVEQISSLITLNIYNKI